MKAIVIAGAASGVGKTTVAAAIMGVLTVRSYKVQPFVEAVASRTQRDSPSEQRD